MSGTRETGAAETGAAMQGTALRERLKTRARALACMREFFAARDVVEVETPALSRAAATDPALSSLKVDVAALGGTHYLHTSPEHAMKRLLAAGSGDIFQLCRVFRDGERGRWHSPEFLMLEWYRTGFDELELMDEVHELLVAVLAPGIPALERYDIGYGDVFAAAFGVDAHRLDAAGAAALARALGERGIDVPDALAPDGLLDLALASVVAPGWPADTAVFLYDYPASQAALAALRPGSPPVARRFEVFVNGLELGNGFFELTDPVRQRRRFEADLACRRERGLPEPPLDEALIAALEQGLPPCSGVALGVDRLLALLTGGKGVRALFP